MNGKPFPAPKRYPNMIVTTAVDAARNANNKVVGQKLAETIIKSTTLNGRILMLKHGQVCYRNLISISFPVCNFGMWSITVGEPLRCIQVIGRQTCSNTIKTVFRLHTLIAKSILLIRGGRHVSDISRV